MAKKQKHCVAGFMGGHACGKPTSVKCPSCKRFICQKHLNVDATCYVCQPKLPLSAPDPLGDFVKEREEAAKALNKKLGREPARKRPMGLQAKFNFTQDGEVGLIMTTVTMSLKTADANSDLLMALWNLEHAFNAIRSNTILNIQLLEVQ